MPWKNQQGSNMSNNICASMCVCKPIPIPFQIYKTKSYTSVINFFFWGMMIVMEKNPQIFLQIMKEKETLKNKIFQAEQNILLYSK